MSRTVEEYDVHRSTIAVWIQAENTLYGFKWGSVVPILSLLRKEREIGFP